MKELSETLAALGIRLRGEEKSKSAAHLLKMCLSMSSLSLPLSHAGSFTHTHTHTHTHAHTNLFLDVSSYSGKWAFTHIHARALIYTQNVFESDLLSPLPLSLPSPLSLSFSLRPSAAQFFGGCEGFTQMIVDHIPSPKQFARRKVGTHTNHTLTHTHTQIQYIA